MYLMLCYSTKDDSMIMAAFIFNLRCIFSVLLYVLVLEIKGKREGVVAALEEAS